MTYPSVFKTFCNRPAVVATVMALIAFLVFAPTVRCGFVDWDDDEYVFDNPLVLEGLTGEGMRRACTEVVFFSWAPLTILSYQLDASVFGTEPWGFHLTNVVAHAVSTGLLYLVLLRMTGSAARSAAASVLWAVHPLRVESVAWIAERKDVLSVLFLMLALLAYDWYCRGPGIPRYLAVCAAMLGSLLCKSTLVTLPVLLVLLDVWPLGRIAIPGLDAPRRGDNAESPYPVRPAWSVLIEKIPLLGICFVFSRITLATQADAIVSQISRSFLRARLPNAVTSVAWYLSKSLLPTGLHPACENLGSDVSWPLVAVSAAALLVIAVLVVISGRSQPFLPWGLSWCLVSMLPVLGLVQTGFQSHADRFTYIPHIGLAVAVVWAACDLAGRCHLPGAMVPIAFVLMSVMSVALTERQIGIWASRDTLWRHVLAVDPGNSVALGKKAIHAATAGRSEEAEKLFLLSLDRKAYPWAIAGLAKIYHKRGDVVRMERYRDWAIRVSPRDERISRLLRDLPAPQKAAARPAVAPRVRRLLERGAIELNAGRLPAALAAFEEAIEAGPDCADAQNLAGIACVGLDRQPEAERRFRQAITLDPNNFGYRVNLAMVLWVLQDWPSCLAACEEALAIKPDDVEVQTMLKRTQRKIGETPTGDR